MRAYLLALASAFAAAACGGSTTDAATAGDDAGGTGTDASTTDSAAPASGMPCEVEDVFVRNCQSCHSATPQFGAPMPLVTRDDLLAPSPSDATKKVWEQVKDRVHRGLDEVGRMPQKPNAPLSAADLATLDGWFAAGTPERTAACTEPTPDAGGGTDASTKPLSCTPDADLHAKSKWVMPKDRSDVYVCYGVELPVSAKKHVVGIEPRIDNSKIVHHMLLMQSDSPVDPTPFECSEGAIANYRMLYGWAPGVGPFEMPAAAGLPADPPTAHFVVQIHYNNVKALEGEADDSGFDLCTTETLRPNDADVLAFGSLKFSIPAKAKRDITATFTAPSFMPEVHAIGAFPHMHQLGKSIATTLKPKAGGSFDLGTDPAFDFNNQFFAVLPDTIVKPGDKVETRCVWENTTDKAVSYGEYTSDEMCYSFTMYYPKITLSAWKWGAPAYLSTTTVNE